MNSFRFESVFKAFFLCRIAKDNHIEGDYIIGKREKIFDIFHSVFKGSNSHPSSAKAELNGFKKDVFAGSGKVLGP